MDGCNRDKFEKVDIHDEPAGDWYSEAMVGTRGNVLSNLANVCLALREDPKWRGRLTFNEFTSIELIDGRPITDQDITEVQEKLQLCGLRSIGSGPVRDGMLRVARESGFHPVRRRLDALVWDGAPRLDAVLSVYFGAADTDYSRAVGRMAMLAMVARVFDPGCKNDHMLILEGKQGIGKSSACRILAGGDDYFSDSLPLDLGNKDSSAHLSGKWVVEVAELASFRKSDAEHLKSFISRQVERFRPAYGRQEVTRPRQCIFIGSTNSCDYLQDPTGGRRFWPVGCGKIDLNGLTHDREQILAEAVSRYRNGEKWWPDRAFEAQHITPEQEGRLNHDVWHDLVADFVSREHMLGNRVTTREILTGKLGFQPKEIKEADRRRITSILQSLRWVPKRSRDKRFWVPGDAG